MVWDATNVVGLMNYIYLYNNVRSINFVIFSLGSLASPIVALSWAMPHHLAGAQHVVLELAHSSLVGVLDSSIERKAMQFAACMQSAHAAGYILEDKWSICSALWCVPCSDGPKGAVQAW